ncbi:IS4 family transposase [Anoxybacteroides amylolyticum]|uniref:Transposase DDE domain protein n=1 Tax=Anoxybacteroides amylolyticum TaxID=294699 RepID=A0A167T9T5_9BACL|nr:IS4 family transposase [Anoxybacillus amylolyticus]ANB59679.1 transposase DDE domain protein [Anoxybacillus amylolyticus]
MDCITFQALWKELDVRVFSKLIPIIDVDKYIKKLSAYRFLQLLIFAQINEIDSLTAMAKHVKDTKELHTELELDAISTSQLSRKLKHLSPSLFETIFHHLVQTIQRQLQATPTVEQIRRLHIIDSTTMSMCIGQYPWATFRKIKAGVRLHLRVVVQNDMTIPDRGVLLPAKHADRTQMEELITYDEEAIYLFDRGYVDYQQFDRLCEEGISFITRLKDNAIVEVWNEQRPDDESMMRDQEGVLGTNKTKMKHPLRLIQTKDSEGTVIVLVTNCFDRSAKEIADLYRCRWKIETFFKWMKQHLRIKRFWGTSENAVYTQIWVALITYCLQVLLQVKTGYKGTWLEVKRTIRLLLFQPFSEVIRSLFRKPSRKSKGRRTYRWVEEFERIEQQWVEGEVEHLDELEYDPIFLAPWK